MKISLWILTPQPEIVRKYVYYQLIDIVRALEDALWYPTSYLH